jgi:hypothetical protein
LTRRDAKGGGDQRVGGTGRKVAEAPAGGQRPDIDAFEAVHSHAQAAKVSFAQIVPGDKLHGPIAESALLDGAIQQRDDLAVSGIGHDRLEEGTDRGRAAFEDLYKVRVDMKKPPGNAERRILHLRLADEILDLVVGADGSRLADIGDAPDQGISPDGTKSIQNLLDFASAAGCLLMLFRRRDWSREGGFQHAADTQSKARVTALFHP